MHFEARSREKLAILPNTVTCSPSLQHTTCSLQRESGLYENEGGALPKGSLNSKIATSRAKIELAMWSTRSTKPRRKIILGTIKRFESYREICNNAVDYRIPGIPLSTVEQQDTTRDNKAKKLIEKFENHQHMESFLQDLSQTQKINKFSGQSKELIADMNNTEIFELCEISSKQQCPECNTYRETGVNLLQLWKTLAVTNIVRAEQLRRHSIPGYVIKKNSSRGAKHGPSERQRIYYQAKQVLKKARQKKHGSHPTILVRWCASETYRTSLSLIGWKEKDICNVTELLWRNISTSQQERREFKIRSIG